MVRGLYMTDIEVIMSDNLKNNGIDAVYNFPIRGSYILDFAIPSLKIDIECDGSFWHKEGNSHDRVRNWFLRRRGWTVLRFSDNEIKEDIGKCIDKIKETIGKVGKNGKES